MAASTCDRIRFADITAPLTPERFFAEYWTREAVHLRTANRTFDDQFSWDALTTILNAGDIAFPKIKVSRNEGGIPSEQFTSDAGGQRLVDGRSVLKLFQEGASFGITGADSHWAPLRSIVDCLYDALLESVHTNVYCSPANTQGFQCHFDLHEVFVLQVAGEKHWRVFRPTTDAPVSSWRAEDSPHASTAPYIDVVLRQGDVLYVPRGHWHYAIAKDSTSLHVTVGVTCRKGTAFLDWLSGQLLQESTWRRNVPLLASAAMDGAFEMPAAFANWAEEIKRSLAGKLAEPDLFERFCKDTLGSVPPAHNASLLDDGLPLDQVRFERPAGRRHYFADRPERDGGSAGSADDSITVTVAGTEIQLEGVDAGLIRRIFNAESFTLADVHTWKPDVAIADVAELLTELTRSGFLIARRQSQKIEPTNQLPTDPHI
jgi:ribosomal protein L16 Arg81 hydroxylase